MITSVLNHCSLVLKWKYLLKVRGILKRNVLWKSFSCFSFKGSRKFSCEITLWSEKWVNAESINLGWTEETDQVSIIISCDSHVIVMWSSCDFRYLLDLDYLGDPAWECLVQMNDWIHGLFAQCKNNYQLMLPTIQGTVV